MAKVKSGGIKESMPAKISPMREPFDHPDWVYEIKWDGYRIIAYVRDGKVKLYSR